MPQQSTRLLVVLGVSVMCGVLAGGCPVGYADLPTDAQSELVSPGSYWIEEDSGELVYYELPDTRDGVGKWVMLLEADTSWFDGAGWYVLSEDLDWSRDTALDRVTLDDVIQTHDPMP